MSLIGYARVSTSEQDLALQCDALVAAGVTRIFEDRGVSGAKVERSGLNSALAFLREGDTLVVWKLDRLGRSMTHLLQTVAELEGRGVGFRSLTETIDTTTPTGRLVFHLFGALGQFERDLIRERTGAGLQAAAARGRKGGATRCPYIRKGSAGPFADRIRPKCARGRGTREGEQVRSLHGTKGHPGAKQIA